MDLSNYTLNGFVNISKFLGMIMRQEWDRESFFIPLPRFLKYPPTLEFHCLLIDFYVYDQQDSFLLKIKKKKF